jgi:acetone carboxylase gamma subunit
MRINAYLTVDSGAGGPVLRCHCGHVLGPADRPYKELSLEARLPVAALGPHVDPDGLGGDRFEVREYYCPGCLVLFESEVARPDDALLVDVELTLDGAAERG